MNQLVSKGAFRTASLAFVALVAFASMVSLSGCGNMKAEAEKEKTEVVAAGTTIVAALQSTITTGSAKVGDPVVLRTTQAVRVNEMEIVPAGATIRGEVTHSKGAGRVAGGAQLTLRFTTLET